MLLTWLGTSQTMLQISILFRVSEYTVVHSVHDLVEKLFNLRQDFIKWPFGVEAQQVMNDFQEKQDMQGVLGAIDGSPLHVLESPGDYVNRKNFILESSRLLTLLSSELQRQSVGGRVQLQFIHTFESCTCTIQMYE